MEELKRLETLIGNDNLNKINNTSCLVIGLGGVGGYTVESLARSGIGRLILVDYDIIDITNINRQIIALHSNIGIDKTKAFKDRINDINKNCDVKIINEFINEDNIDILFNEKIDYIIDACDTVNTKELLIKYALLNNIKIISSMGMANKLKPELIEITDIWKTSYDPLAKIIRSRLKKENISKKVMVVSSKEKVIKTSNNSLGSCSFVPSVAGLLISSYIINDIIKE